MGTTFKLSLRYWTPEEGARLFPDCIIELHAVANACDAVENSLRSMVASKPKSLESRWDIFDRLRKSKTFAKTSAVPRAEAARPKQNS